MSLEPSVPRRTLLKSALLITVGASLLAVPPEAQARTKRAKVLGEGEAEGNPTQVPLLPLAGEDSLPVRPDTLRKTASPALSSAPVLSVPRSREREVQQWVRRLSGTEKEATALYLRRAGRYAPLIQARLRERGMPEDFLYLPLLESGYLPNARSPASSATGLWQFLRGTGLHYGLEISAYVDERRDPVASTEAALEYLDSLYQEFGSWLLAAAAYNAGSVRVARLLRARYGRSRGGDQAFWGIASSLPAETRRYVPRLLAASRIGRKPERYGLHPVPSEAPLSYEEVEIEGGISLRAVAAAAGVPVEEVWEMNPHLLRRQTPPGRAWKVRVPAGEGARRLEREAYRIADVQNALRFPYMVKRGESLGGLARRYGISIARLRAANGELLADGLQPGERLQVPLPEVPPSPLSRLPILEPRLSVPGLSGLPVPGGSLIH